MLRDGVAPRLGRTISHRSRQTKDDQAPDPPPARSRRHRGGQGCM